MNDQQAGVIIKYSHIADSGAADAHAETLIHKKRCLEAITLMFTSAFSLYTRGNILIEKLLGPQTYFGQEHRFHNTVAISVPY